jgi:PAS domain S-box-containing protein
MGDNNNTIDKATTQLEQTLIKRVEELERINLRLQGENEARELAQEGLRYGQKFLREVISSIEDTYITVFDKNCQVNFIWGSNKLKEKYGIIFQDYMGKDSNVFNPQLAKRIHQVFETNHSFHGEWSENRQGNIIWWDYTLSPIIDEDNEMVAVVSAARDITEHKKKEDKLQLHSQIMTNLTEGVYLSRLEDGIIVYTNPTFEEMFGYNPGEMLGKYVAIVNAPTEKTPEETKQNITQILIKTGRWQGEVRNIKKDGTHFWCNANVSLFDHPDYGRVIVSVHTDITERKKNEDSQRENEKRLQKIIENSEAGYFFINTDGYFQHVNSAWLRMHKFSNLDEIIGRHFSETQVDIDLPEANKIVEDLLQGAPLPSGEFSRRCKDGTIEYHSFSVNPVVKKEKITGFEGFLIDTTESHKMAVKLKENEGKLLYAEKIASFGYWEWNLITDELYWSDEAFRIYGFEPQEFTPTFEIFRKSVHPDDLEFVQKHLDNALENDVKYDTDFRIVRPSSEVVYINVIGDVTRDANGKPTMFAGTQIIITDRKKMEEKLIESEEVLRSTLESIEEGILVVNEQGQVTHYNSKFISMWHIPHEIIKEKDDKKLLDYVLNQLKDPEAFQSKVEELYRTRNEDVDTLYFKDGRIFERSSNPLTLNGEIRGRVWSFRDITERRKMAEKIRMSEEKYQNLFNKAHVGIFSTRISDGKCMDCNEYLANMMGYNTIEEVLKEFVGSEHYVNNDDREKILEIVKKNGFIENHEVQVTKKDGTPYWVNYSVNLDLERQRLEGIVIDITDRKNSEQKLKESAANFSSAIESLPFPFYMVDSSGKYIMQNASAKKIWGDLIGKSPKDIAKDEEVLSYWLSNNSRVFSGETIDNESDYLINGELRYFYDILAPIFVDNRIPRILGVNIDITKRKMAERNLRDSEKKFRKIVENNPGFIVFVNTEGIIIDFNRLEKGFTKETVLGHSLFSKNFYETEEQCESVREAFRVLLKSGKKANYEHSQISPDGSRSFYENILSPFDYDNEGNIISVQLTIRDITERKNSELKLRNSEEKLKMFMDSATDGFFLWDPELNYIDANKVAVQTTGLTKEELIGKNMLDIAPNLRETGRYDQYLDVLKTGEPFSTEDVIFNKQDGSINASFFIRGFKVGNNLGVIFTDISERKISDEKIKQLAKFPSENPNPVLRISKDGVILYKNEVSSHLLKTWNYIDGNTIPNYWQKVVDESLHTREIQHAEIESNGKIYSLTFTPVEESNYVNIYGLDITERKEREDQLQLQSEIIENMSECVYLIRADDGIIIYANPAFEVMFGYNPGEIIGKDVSIVNAPTNKTPEETKEDIIKTLLETGEWHGEVRNIKKDGKHFWCYANVSLFNHPLYGKVMVSIHTDISERKKIELKLKESEEQHRHLANELELIFDHIPAVIAYKDTENNFLRINKFMADGHNLKKEDMEGKSAFEFYPHNEAQKYWEDDLEVINSKKPKLNFIEPWETPEGKRWVNTSKIPYIDEGGNVRGIIALAINITDRIEAEKKLNESEEKLRELIDAVPIGISISSPKGTYLECNSQAMQIFGHDSREEFLKTPVINHYYNPEDRAKFLRSIAKNEVKDFELQLKKRDGTIFWASLTSVSQNRGKLNVFINTVQDITERKEKEDELRLHSEMMENMSEGVYLIRLEDGIIVYTNPAFEKMFGYHRGEMINKYVAIVNAPTDKSPEETKGEIMGILRETGEWHGEVKNIKKDGTHFWCYANVSLFDHPRYGKVIVSIHTDISERKKSEVTIKQLAKFPSENPNPILRVSKDGYLLYSNNAGKPVLDTWNFKENFPISKKYHQFVLNSLITGEKHYTELECICEEKNCIDKIFSLTFAPVEGTNYVNIYGFDITERVKTEESLKESEEKFRLIFVNVRDGIVGVNEEGNFEFANITAAKNLGYELDEFLKLNITDISASESKKEFKQHFSDILGGKRLKFETKHRKKDNILRNIEVSLNVFDLKDKKISLALWHDITDFKRSEEALRESGEILRSILENTPDYIIMMDIEGEIQFINRPFIGMRRGEINNKNIFSLIPLEYHGILKNSISQMIKSGRAENIKLKIKNPLGNPNLYEGHFGYIKSDWEIIGLIIIFSENN